MKRALVLVAMFLPLGAAAGDYTCDDVASWLADGQSALVVHHRLDLAGQPDLEACEAYRAAASGEVPAASPAPPQATTAYATPTTPQVPWVRGELATRRLAAAWASPWRLDRGLVRVQGGKRRLRVADLAAELGDTATVERHLAIERKLRTGSGLALTGGTLLAAGGVVFVTGLGIGALSVVLGLATLNPELLFAGIVTAGTVMLGGIVVGAAGLITLGIGSAMLGTYGQEKWRPYRTYDEETIRRGIDAHNARIGVQGRF